MIIENLVKKHKAIEEVGDYRDDEGLLVCGKCNTRKEAKFEFAGSMNFVKCLCKCDEEEQQRLLEEKLKRQKILNFQKRQALIDSCYREIYLSNSDTKLEVVERYIEKFKDLKKENIGLMIYGGVGNGKTFMASIIANELCKKGYTVLMEHITKSLNKISRYDNEGYIQELEEVDLVILDDVGVNRSSEFQNEQFNKLIDIRYASKKPLIITTNLNRKNLLDEKDLSLSRTYSRLLEMTQPLPITSKSRRVDIAKSKNDIAKEILGFNTNDNR